MSGAATPFGSSATPAPATRVAEELLWHFLRDGRLEDLVFQRRPIIGPFVADFACPELDLIVELEALPRTPTGGPRCDEARTAYLRSRGYEVMRICEHDVLLGTASVLETILERLLDRRPIPLTARTPRTRDGGQGPRALESTGQPSRDPSTSGGGGERS